MTSPKTVLIVDDDKDLREAIGLGLKRRGYLTLFAENGTRAFEIVRAQPVDAVVTDVRMPGGDGISLLDNIRQLGPGAPAVVLISGFSDLSPEQAVKRGAFACFCKPFSRSELYAALDAAFKAAA